MFIPTVKGPLKLFYCDAVFFCTDASSSRALCEICWLRHCATRQEVPGSIHGRVLGKFQVTCSFCQHSVALGSTQPVTEMSTKEFPWG
jgi:hypothetical protein